MGSNAVVDSSLVSLSGFGAADGWVLVTCAIPGLLSPAAADGPVLSLCMSLDQMLLWLWVLRLQVQRHRWLLLVMSRLPLVLF